MHILYIPSSLRKPDEGVRPIAIGEVLRRLAAKACFQSIKEAAASFLRPGQLGVAVRGGAEGIVHSLSTLVEERRDADDFVCLKFDN